LIGRKPLNLIVGWSGQFLIFVVPCHFSQVVAKWPENQILIPNWTYFHCPDANLVYPTAAAIKKIFIQESSAVYVVLGKNPRT